MESEVLGEKVEWEARRVAAAFGLGEWNEDVWYMHSHDSLFSGTRGELEVSWRISPQAVAVHLRVGHGQFEDCIVTWREFAWKLTASRLHQSYNEFMVRGLYCLGIEDEEVFSELNPSLSFHEKLELRLSLPREFWPAKWLDEK